jgi:hypothetical protein
MLVFLGDMKMLVFVTCLFDIALISYHLASAYGWRLLNRRNRGSNVLVERVES